MARLQNNLVPASTYGTKATYKQSLPHELLFFEKQKNVVWTTEKHKALLFEDLKSTALLLTVMTC